MKLFKNLTETAKYMLYGMSGLFVIFLVLGIFFIQFVFRFESIPQFALGLLSGCIVSSIRIILMDKSINRSVEMEGKKAQNYNQLQFLLRYIIVIGYAVLLVILHRYLGVFGGVLGLFCMQLSAYVGNYMVNKKVGIEK